MYELEAAALLSSSRWCCRTSLCSGQVALRFADQAAASDLDPRRARRRTVALPHTEGCGVSSGPAENTYARMMTSYLAHPNVALALLLEHGCEKTHNDYFRSRLVEEGLDPSGSGGPASSSTSRERK